MINDPYVSQTAIRAPRVRVIHNGAVLPGVLSASVTSNNWYQCDAFEASFAFNAGPPGWWDVNPPFVLTVQFSLDGQSWQTMIVGEVDGVKVDIQSGKLDLHGRDLTSRLIEAPTKEAFVNQTSSQIVATLAKRHGMTTNITATTTLVGRYYEQDHSVTTTGQFSRTTTEWDLLVYLAQREGFDVFMSGNTLNFQPSPSQKASPFVINWTPAPNVRLNAVSLHMERRLDMAKPIEASVTSWSSRQGRAFTKTAKTTPTAAAGATSPGTGTPTTTQKYTIVRPNLTETAAQNLANQIVSENSLHERNVTVQMPGELTLTPRNMVRLQGTRTSFDQVYFIACIDRTITYDGGFVQALRLKNSSPRTQSTV